MSNRTRNSENRQSKCAGEPAALEMRGHPALSGRMWRQPGHRRRETVNWKVDGEKHPAPSTQHREQPCSLQNTGPQMCGMDEKVQQAPPGVPEAWASPKRTSSELMTDAASDSGSLAAPAVKEGSPGAPPGKCHTPATGEPHAHKTDCASPRGQRQLKGHRKETLANMEPQAPHKSKSRTATQTRLRTTWSVGLRHDVLQVGDTWEMEQPKEEAKLGWPHAQPHMPSRMAWAQAAGPSPVSRAAAHPHGNSGCQ